MWKDENLAEGYFDRLDKDHDGILAEDEIAPLSVTIPWPALNESLLLKKCITSINQAHKRP